MMNVHELEDKATVKQNRPIVRDSRSIHSLRAELDLEIQQMSRLIIFCLTFPMSRLSLLQLATLYFNRVHDYIQYCSYRHLTSTLSDERMVTTPSSRFNQS